MGPGVPSVCGNVEIPEAPQILPLGPVMVQELGPELGPLSRVNLISPTAEGGTHPEYEPY